jgi:uncharacterized protein YutE (UPF0331/DUF86 family)
MAIMKKDTIKTILKESYNEFQRIQNQASNRIYASGYRDAIIMIAEALGVPLREPMGTIDMKNKEDYENMIRLLKSSGIKYETNPNAEI